MLDCVSIESARRLGDWISGARAAKQESVLASAGQGGRRVERVTGAAPRDRALERRIKAEMSGQASSPEDELDLDDVTPTLARSGAIAPPGFWEPEVPYEEHASTSGQSASTGATGLEGVDELHQGRFSLTLDLVDPGKVTLEMTKTSLPIYRIGRSGERTMVETDSYIIVTTVPKSGYVVKDTQPSRVPTPNSLTELSPATEKASDEIMLDVPPATNSAPSRPPQSRLTVLPSPKAAPRGLTLPSLHGTSAPTAGNQLTPTDEIMALDLVESSDGQASRPLYFSSDGTVSRPRGPLLNGVDERGKPLDVHVLLETTDWSKTGLGPRENWPQSLKTVGECAGTLLWFAC